MTHNAIGCAHAAKSNGIKLIDIIADEGISGSTLDRPGLQAALQIIKGGRANTLIVVKLDRLSRSIRDVCALVEDFFADERSSPVIGLRHDQHAQCRGAHAHDEPRKLQPVRKGDDFRADPRCAAAHEGARSPSSGTHPTAMSTQNRLDNKGRRDSGTAGR